MVRAAWSDSAEHARIPIGGNWVLQSAFGSVWVRLCQGNNCVCKAHGITGSTFFACHPLVSYPARLAELAPRWSCCLCIRCKTSCEHKCAAILSTIETPYDAVPAQQVSGTNGPASGTNGDSPPRCDAHETLFDCKTCVLI